MLMQPTSIPPLHSSEPGQPAWRIALFYPEQGGWTEADYFALDGGPLVEFSDGCVEVLDMPSKEHQRMAQFLFVLLRQYVIEHRCGEVFMAPLPVRLWPRKFREPDVVYVARGRGEIDGYPDSADLVIEIVSPGIENRRRDLETKPVEYARAGIAEYWAVDPETETVTAHHLVGSQYRTTTFTKTDSAVSKTLPGFEVPVSDILSSASSAAENH